MKTLFMAGAAVAAAVLLAACGGGSSEVETQPAAADTVPASATASVRAYTQFAGSLSPTENQPPLKMNDMAAPTSESDEPSPVS